MVVLRSTYMEKIMGSIHQLSKFFLIFLLFSKIQMFRNHPRIHTVAGDGMTQMEASRGKPKFSQGIHSLCILHSFIYL
jgi:hypothetical protein